MNLLVLGGTRFVGRHFAEAALEAGHQVTLFHRGESGGSLFEGRVRRVLGDRKVGFAGLAGETFDAVVDTCGYLPGDVSRAVQELGPNCGRYLFISTISVYDPAGETPLTEQSPQVPIGDPNATEVTGETYGYLKVLCEEALLTLAERATIVRPGLIVGPHDPTDRFTYWVARLARGGDVLAPLETDCALQAIDARDLAQFTLGLLERGVAGTVHATAPSPPATFASFMAAWQAHAPEGTRVYQVPKSFRESQGIQDWVDLPLFSGENDGLMKCSLTKAQSEGLAWRPLAETVADTLDWFLRERGVGSALKTGLSPEREEAALRVWWS